MTESVVVVTVTETEVMLGWRLRVTVVVDRGGLTSDRAVMGVTTVVGEGQAARCLGQVGLGSGVDMSNGVMGDRRLMHAHDDL